MRFAGRQDFERDKHCRNEKDNRHRDPHQGRRALLVFERRKTKHSGCRNIGRVDHLVTKCEEPGKRVAWQRRAEKIQRDGPLGPSWPARPRLHDRPPEHHSGAQERRVLQFMQPVPPQRQLKHRRYMPSDQAMARSSYLPFGKLVSSCRYSASHLGNNSNSQHPSEATWSMAVGACRSLSPPLFI
jgi:hypothetical protein